MNNYRLILSLLMILCWGLAPLATSCQNVCPTGLFVDSQNPHIDADLQTKIGSLTGSLTIHDGYCQYAIEGQSDGPIDSIVWEALLVAGTEENCCQLIEFTGSNSEDCNVIDGWATKHCASGIQERPMMLKRPK